MPDSGFVPELSERAQDRLADKKLCILMVGLPARGKSYIAKKLRRWLNWTGYTTQVFNVGNRRRKSATTPAQDAAFFDHTRPALNRLRDELAMTSLAECIDWLRREGSVAIHDATNTTKERRMLLLERCQQESDWMQTLFVESICTDEAVLNENIAMKLQSPDYINMDPHKARADFLARLDNYMRVYQPIQEEEMLAYIKVINVGRRVIANEIHGFLGSQIVFYLLNMHIRSRRIWLTRHGESEDNVLDIIGGDSPLTERGHEFSRRLGLFFKAHPVKTVWTSTLQRAVQTAQSLSEELPVTKLRVLNELHAGACDGMSYREMKVKQPDLFSARQAHKLSFRYPSGGESYLDVVERLRPTIIELERLQEDTLVITHRGVMRTIIAYFMDVPLERLPYIEVPLHTLVCLTPSAYGCQQDMFPLMDAPSKL
eukprot:CAMPEP_0177631708 /NCGR_PEP_ID=MMETSP0447-20121125/1892_1 /TAXON_ID=0 /ORGANISM="Stygamoeba regulata, Strain BSH-02190019" /LENGTH=428 /DNA_ID=CAMNT_0019133207 /DNA_START=116 /DNA_END=1402 /DNA_ORIENTATION=+